MSTLKKFFKKFFSKLFFLKVLAKSFREMTIPSVSSIYIYTTVFRIIMRCSICCNEDIQHVSNLPCSSCKGYDKAFCFNCFGKMASYHLDTFNLIIKCPFCRLSIEFDFQNDDVVMNQNDLHCTLSKTSELANYIVKGYRKYCESLQLNDAEFDMYLNRLIDNETELIIFKNFLKSRTIPNTDTSIGTSHDIKAPVVVLMPVPAAYTWWLNHQQVVRAISSHHTHDILSTLSSSSHKSV